MNTEKNKRLHTVRVSLPEINSMSFCICSSLNGGKSLTTSSSSSAKSNTTAPSAIDNFFVNSVNVLSRFCVSFSAAVVLHNKNGKDSNIRFRHYHQKLLTICMCLVHTFLFQPF